MARVSVDIPCVMFPLRFPIKVWLHMFLFAT